MNHSQISLSEEHLAETMGWAEELLTSPNIPTDHGLQEIRNVLSVDILSANQNALLMEPRLRSEAHTRLVQTIDVARDIYAQVVLRQEEPDNSQGEEPHVLRIAGISAELAKSLKNFTDKQIRQTEAQRVLQSLEQHHARLQMETRRNDDAVLDLPLQQAIACVEEHIQKVRARLRPAEKKNQQRPGANRRGKGR